MLIKDIAICIRASDYSETSQVLTFFTQKHGKISAIAKGSKRAKSAFDGAVEVFSCGQVVYSQPVTEKLATLTEFEQKSGFSGLMKGLFCYYCALFGVELVNSMTDEMDAHPQLFQGLMEFLKRLEEAAREQDNKHQGLILLVLFQLRVLTEVGLRPVLTACVNCKNAFSESWEGVYFSSEGKGLVCRDCEGAYMDKARVSRKCAKSFSDIKLLVRADEKTLMEIEKVLVSYFSDILGRRPRMARYVVG